MSYSPFDFTGAIVTSCVLATFVSALAGHVYLRRKRPFRFGVVGTTVMLLVLWLAVGFVAFDRLYWGP